MEDRAGVESAQLAKLDYWSSDMGLRSLGSLLQALDGASTVDGQHAYLASNLGRHISARIDQATAGAEEGTPRLAIRFEALASELRAMHEVARRIERTIGLAAVTGGELGELERLVLLRLLGELKARLPKAHDKEIDIAMQQHWDDLGVSG